MLRYHKLSENIEKLISENIASNISNPYKASDRDALRRNRSKDVNSLLRPSYSRDIDKILHLPLYNRYNDKTQVFHL